MAKKQLPKGVFEIDGRLYSVRCLKVGAKDGDPNEWDQFLDDVGEDDSLVHWKGTFFWGQETTGTASYRAHRGNRSARYWYFDSQSLRNVNFGFRPVLVPLDDGMKRDLAAHDGTTIRMGRFNAVSKPADDEPKLISFLDSDENDKANTLEWVAWEGKMVCTRVLCPGVSWDDLHAQGFVFPSHQCAEMPVIGNGPMKTIITLGDGTEVEGRWQPMQIKSKDIRLAFRLPNLSLYEFASKLRLSKPCWWMETSAASIQTGEVKTLADAKKELKTLENTTLLDEDGTLYIKSMLKGEPCYYIEADGFIKISEFFGDEDTVYHMRYFRLDELDKAIEVAVALSNSRTEQDEIRDKAEQLRFPFFEPDALRMPSYPNREAVYAERLARACLADMFGEQGASLEELPGFENMLAAMAQVVFNDGRMRSVAFIDCEKRAKALIAARLVGKFED